MALQSFPVISVKGKPFECGLGHGSQARQLIRKNIDSYFELWGAMWGAKRPEVLEQCRKFVPIIGEYDASILEELEGVARGADLSLEEIIALNARYELVWAQSIAGEAAREGCTSLCALPEVTEGGHTIVGQNWDYKPRFSGLSIVLEVEQENRPNLLTQTEAGIIGLKGMNSAGIGVCINALVSSRDKFEPRTPLLIVIRGVLNADSFSQALKAVLCTKTAVSANLLIAHRDGEAIDLEVTPDDVGFLQAEDGILTHSNNFLAFTNREDLIDTLKPDIPDSLFRYSRSRRLLATDRGHINVGSFQRVLSDHFSYPNSICRHVDSRDEEPKQLATLSSVVMDLEERALYMTEGPPCQNEYHRLSPQSLVLS